MRFVLATQKKKRNHACAVYLKMLGSAVLFSGVVAPTSEES